MDRPRVALVVSGTATEAEWCVMALSSGVLLGPYEILGPLGEGGMGEVYRARDTRLERSVAIKVLPARLADDPERRERFEREARAVAALSHPNVCALFDIGRHDDAPYLVMEYLDGDTLADRIRRGALPVGEALRLAAQIADGLAAAHAEGIVHRDLKPANVKVTADGRAKVLDFGLAVHADAPPPAADGANRPTASMRMTAPHTVLGTAGYMAPEQARGQPVDRRADVWALGLLVFEMLTGRVLFVGDTAADLLVAVLNQEIRLDDLPDGTPAEVRSLLARCLERDVDRRVRDMAELVAAFGGADSGVAPVAEETPPSTDRSRDRSLAVLPFANLSPDPDNEYFSDGLTEEVIADLAKVDSLRVISRSTAMRFKGGTRDLSSIAQKLGVRHVLEGSVRKAGNQVRITTQLVDVDRDAPVWSEKFSGTLDDVFEMQEKVSRSIVEALRIKLSDTEKQALSARPDVDGAVYDVYLRTKRDIAGFRREGLDRALRELERVLESAGDEPLLLHGLGQAHWQYHNAGLDTDPARLDRAEEYARRLRAVDPEGPYTDALLGIINIARGRLHEWVRCSRAAVEKAPRDAESNVWLALGLALSIDPMCDLLHFGLGSVEHFEGRFEQAIAHYRQAMALTPEHPGWAMVIAQAAAGANDFERLEEIVRKWAMPPEAHPLAALPHLLLQASRGERTLMDRIVDDAYRARLWPDLEYTFIMGEIHAILGDADESLRWLERSAERGWICYPFMAEHDRALDRLRGEARFDAYLEDVREKWEAFRAEFEE
jgi:serine/threonine protein kinase